MELLKEGIAYLFGPGTYERTITILHTAVEKTKLAETEKAGALKRLLEFDLSVPPELFQGALHASNAFNVTVRCGSRFEIALWQCARAIVFPP